MTSPLSVDTQAEWEFRNGAWRLIAGTPLEPPPPVTVGPVPSEFAHDVTRSSGAAVSNIAWPAGHQAGYLGVLVVETAAEALGINPPTGFAHVAGSPFNTGTPGAAGAIGLHVLWKRATSSSEPVVDIGDSGDHQIARLFVYKDIVASGVPYEGASVQIFTSSSTGVAVPGMTTLGPNRRVLQLVAYSTDTLTSQSGSWSNADLVNFAEVAESVSTVGFGGGFSLAHGEAPDAGPVGAATATLLTASNQIRFVMALLPTSTGGGGGGGPPPAAAPLRYGPYGQFTGMIGAGPRGLQSDVPYFTIAGTVPQSEGEASMNSMIDIADAKDVLIICRVSNNPSTYGVNVGFNFTNFKAQLDKIVGWTKLADALNRGRCIAYFSDEPYHQTHWGTSWSPTLVNQCARECKIRWPGCTTLIRCDAGRLRSGWNGLPPASSYDAIDYCVMQYETHTMATTQTFPQAWLADKVDAEFLNMGDVPSLNLWAGGNQVTFSGLSECWNTDGAGGNNGVIIGSVPGDLDSSGDFVACATWRGYPGSRQHTVVTSPAWIQRCMDDLIASASAPDVPWVIFWTWAGSVASWAAPYQTRADFVTAQSYAITKLASRASASPLRTPKVYP